MTTNKRAARRIVAAVLEDEEPYLPDDVMALKVDDVARMLAKRDDATLRRGRLEGAEAMLTAVHAAINELDDDALCDHHLDGIAKAQRQCQLDPADIVAALEAEEVLLRLRDDALTDPDLAAQLHEIEAALEAQNVR